MSPVASFSPHRVFQPYKLRLWHMPLTHTTICGLGVGLHLWAERRRANLHYRAGGCARRHLCAVTAAPACQHVPGRELPSPMLTARPPDELSVSFNSPHSSHSTPPPGRSHCFTFHWALLLYSALDVYLSSFSFGTWKPRYLEDHLTKTISSERCEASGRLHDRGDLKPRVTWKKWVSLLCLVMVFIYFAFPPYSRCTISLLHSAVVSMKVKSIFSCNNIQVIIEMLWTRWKQSEESVMSLCTNCRYITSLCTAACTISNSVIYCFISLFSIWTTI